MSDNPLEDSDAREKQIRERAYHLWEADGSKSGQAEEFWERARELVAMEASAHAGELPNPASLPGADPNRTQIVEEASIQENLGEFPGQLSDQGERAQTPAKANRRQA